MTPRILICSASVGSGHGRAAQAVQTAISHLQPQAFVRHVDILNLTNPIFRRIYGKGYFDAIKLFPHIVRYAYERLDRPIKGPVAAIQSLSRGFNRLMLGRFIDLLVEEPWDLVISTHFLPPAIISSLRTARRISFPQMVVTTDFDIHRLWVHSPCERYFTATDEGRMNLAAWGVPLQKIIASGIPIDPVFSEPKSVVECRRRHHIGVGRPVVLQLAGGQGFGPVEKVHQAILDVPMPLEIVTVAGKNDGLHERLDAMPCPTRHRRTVLGYTDRMDELMAASDLVISKPGGLTTSETLARGAAMVIFEPIPGQEDRNCDFLLEHGAAIKLNNLASLSFKLTALIGDPDRLETMRAASIKVARPFAAFEVARAAIALLTPAQPPAGQPTPPPTVSRLQRLRFRRWRRSRRDGVASNV